MSEELDFDFLEPHHLCIPEDAFEKFQAVSMYEEKKLIALPQNVPPNTEPSESDLSTVHQFSPFSASTSTNDFKSPVSSTMSTDSKELPSTRLEHEHSLLYSSNKQNVINTTKHNDNSDMVVSNSENLSNQGNITALDSPSISNDNIVARKRGRKSKKNVMSSIEKEPVDTSQSIQNPDISSTPFISDPETSNIVSTVKMRRGRPTKAILNADTNLNINSSNNAKSNQLSAKKQRGGRRGKSQKNVGILLSEVHSNIQTEPPHKEKELNEDPPIEDLACSSSNSPNIVNVVSKMCKKRSELTSTQLESIDIHDDKLKPDSGGLSFDTDDLDDICLSKLKNVPDQSNNTEPPEEICSKTVKTNEEQNNISQLMDGQQHKSKKRRGRGRKEAEKSFADTVPPPLPSSSQQIESYETLTPTAKDNDDEDGDDVCLSMLKSTANDDIKVECTSASNEQNNDNENVQLVKNETQVSDIDQSNCESNKTPSKLNTTMPLMTDFEYNINSVIEQNLAETKIQSTADNVAMTKRPVRQRVKKLKYEEESDEDPFANVELSDDEPMKGRRGNRYYSDDEYIPGKRGRPAMDSTDSEISDSNSNTKLDDTRKQRRRKFSKKSDNQSPQKRGKKDETPVTKTTDISSLEKDIIQSDDVEVCLDSSVIKTKTGEFQHSQETQQRGHIAEFENFLAKKIPGTSLKIKKVASNTSSETNKLEIPVIDPESKKTIEMCTQTYSVPKKSKEVQTTSHYDVSLKQNIALTPEQSEKACYFLNSVVKTTADLGTLMTQKSEDFIKKKINTDHVTDTTKMDYCVNKSFLLLKLAKQNLQQMEEDLEKQYDEFLKDNDLMKYREEQKKVLPTPRETNSDSDCEIIEVHSVSPQNSRKAKPAFNPKTVFLNKELSIKIAKKPNENKKLNIKGRHTVWINDTVMVKKVKPTQSFLAQDSRNKKPPDNFITTKMVSDFFEYYYNRRALSICAPFVTTDWLNINQDCMCNYFTVKPVQFNTEANHSENNGFRVSGPTSNDTLSKLNQIDAVMLTKNTKISSPQTLFALCLNAVNCRLFHKLNKVPHKTEPEFTKEKNIPVTLFRMCIKTLAKSMMKTNSAIPTPKPTYNFNEVSVPPLKSICHREILTLSLENKSSSNTTQNTALPLKLLCYKRVIEIIYFNLKPKSVNTTSIVSTESFKSLSHKKTQSSLSSFNDLTCKGEDSNEPWDGTSQASTQNGVKTLFSLCVKYIQSRQSERKLLCHKRQAALLMGSNEYNILNQKSYQEITENRVETLFYLCIKYIQSRQVTPRRKFLCHKKQVTPLTGCNECNMGSKKDFDTSVYTRNKVKVLNAPWVTNRNEITKNEVKTLFALCVKYMQSRWITSLQSNISLLTPKSLQKITFERVKYLIYYANKLLDSHQNEDSIMDGLLINCVNTLSEEAFLNLEQCNIDEADSPEYHDDFDNDNNFEQNLGFEDSVAEATWLSKVQVQELRSGINIDNHLDEQQESINYIDEQQLNINGVDEQEESIDDLNERPDNINEVDEQDGINNVNGQQETITQIKLEPEDDITDNFLASIDVKCEPIAGPDEMTIIPNVKSEHGEHIPLQRKNSNSYSVDEFENFISSSKLMRTVADTNTDEIYSQSSERVRMQHEPDDYDINNTDMLNLLVPHTYEVMNHQAAKGSLMESSSDESSKTSKNTAKKLSVRRSRTRPKRSEQKPKSDVVTPIPVVMKEKEKNLNTEVAVLTRKMKEKIRQKEKQDESTDSENENISVRLRSREKKDSDQAKDKSKPASNSKTTALVTDNVTPDPEVTKNNNNVGSKPSASNTKPSASSTKPPASSTRPIEPNSETLNSTSKITDPNSKASSNEIQCSNVDSTEQFEDNVGSFTGFTSIETNEMSNYEKCLKFVYERVIPQKEDEILGNKQTVKDDTVAKKRMESSESDKITLISPDAPIEVLECEPTLPIFEEDLNDNVSIKKKDRTARPASKKKNLIRVSKDPATATFIDRHGWQCYPIDSGDTKLYQNAYISLEKLPESFVQTYFEYQNITTKDKCDEEINRLTNLNSLNRSMVVKDRKYQNDHKRQVKDGKPENMLENDFQEENYSDHYDELMPSDDESPRIEDEAPQPVQKQTENTLAKNSLMNDHESDDEAISKDTTIVKKEPMIVKTEDYQNTKKSKKKTTTTPDETGDLMLTADKMMNKELTLLHAPVVLDDNIKETADKGPVTRQHKKSLTKTPSTTNKTKTEEDSSSEEEKQWVSTKEKLLKRMGKKETTSADDAKRAKLVSEFIERRGGNPDLRLRRPTGRKRRSAKKFLEREKQLRVLQRELFGEMSNDPTISKRSVAAWKGRRNIRKVLDKKSLARSTVIANMEEFERKRRLNTRQNKLRELLGCEEGVNVLVINDEVCLEYDFEENRPIVTIHPFFTKVMKAHQYEGVKFMWDACFESLADIEAGHPGGGCILAHCMGLGKTLQVLALLHTVLTHPRVGIRRVLVCCPLSTVLNWVDEIHKWMGPVTNQIKVFELSKLKKTYERAYQLEDWYNGGGIFIIGYELFRSLSTLDPFLDDVRPTIINKIRTALLEPGPDIVVCDEGHLLKNDCSVLAVAMSRVVTKRRIVLTGTPMQNNLREYYCMVNFVKPNLLGTYSEYSNRFENPIINGQHRDSSEEDIKLMKARTHILHKVLEGCLQRQEASVLYPYLPKKYEYTVFINLTQCQWDLYKHYLYHYSRQVKTNSILKDFHILQKIWSHPQVLHNFQTRAEENRNKIKLEKLEDDLATEDQEDIKDTVATELWWLQYLDGGNMLDSLESSNKFVVVFKILDECVALGDKVLIFSTSLICLNALEYFLKKINKWSLGQEYYRLDGSVPAEVRQKWCREFNAENNVNTKLFLVSTRAGCLGLNMTAANRVIIMDTSWNPAHDIQSIFRVYRFGQKKDCFIYRLVAMGTMEQKIYERSVTKQAIACRVVDEQQIDRHYNMAELTELYRFDETGSSVAGGVAAGVRDVALLRVARDDAALHAVHEHDSLLRSSEQGLPEHERAAAWMQFQQEQTHKQMENKLIANIPKISLKRLHGKHYIKSETIVPEIGADDKSEDFVPPNESRTRRGRKLNKHIVDVPHAIPGPSKIEAPSKTYQRPERRTSKVSKATEQVTEVTEESMVQKISDILIKHDIYNNKAGINVACLVAKVKKIVKQGYISPHDNADELTTSIAKVLLPMPNSMPVINDIVSESINNSILQESTPLEPDNEIIVPTTIKHQKRKGRNTVESLESIAPASAQPEPTSILGTLDYQPPVTESRKRRRAAIAAEKHIDSISQDVIINLDDDLDASDTEFVPNIVTDKSEKTNSSKRNSTTSEAITRKEKRDFVEKIVSTTDIDEVEILPEINSKAADLESVSKLEILLKSKPGPKAYKQKIQQNNNDIIAHKENEELSILLSDDEAPLRITNVPDMSGASPSVAVRDPNSDDEEVPLPLSLLSNKNFINIVAHTYLNGNPMLDADAATLAAQYSTFKALKEAEQTGKNIVSGPIYDIACKVIGKKLLKRMQKANLKSSSFVEEANVTIELKEMIKNTLEHNCQGAQKPTTIKENKLPGSKRRGKNMIEMDSADSIIPDQPSSANVVVPVGMIQSAGSLPSGEFASSECILPDDDMQIITLESSPVQTQLGPASVFPLEMTPIQPKHTIPVISTANKISTESIIPGNHPPIYTKGKIMIPTSVVSGNIRPVTTSEDSQRSSSPKTICLDSDEEDNVTPVKFIRPIIKQTETPVTIAHPINQSEVKLLLPSSAEKILVTQKGRQKPLFLRQVPAPNFTKLVLAPSKNIPPLILPKLAPKPSTQNMPTATLLSATTPSAECLNKLKQAGCKPGDLVKITENGEIEVIQVVPKQPNQAVPTKLAGPKPAKLSGSKNKPFVSEASKSITSKNESPKQKPSVIENPQPAASRTTINVEPKVKVSNTKYSEQNQAQHRFSRARSVSISSSSSSSRAASPSDSNPLSILKNVIHIQAVDEKASTSSEKTTSLKNHTFNKDYHNKNRSELKYSTKATPESNYSTKSAPESKYSNKAALESKYSTKAVSDSKYSTKSASINTAAPKHNKVPVLTQTRDRIKNVKDQMNLIDMPHSSNASTSKTYNKSNALQDIVHLKTHSVKSSKSCDKSTDVGPKTVVRDGTSTLSKSTVFKTAEVAGTVKSGSGASVLNTKIEIKKRPLAADVSSNKKKKIEPMSLKDFNIDDFDDIIELE